MKIEIYTDGACSGNPGRGGFSYLVKTPKGSGYDVREHSEGYLYTTNNRMEMLGVIAALESLPSEVKDVTVVTDSSYVANTILKGWLSGWQKNGWRASGGGSVKNKDLWARYIVAAKGRNVEMKLVRGHMGNPDNERCDYLAVEAYRRPREELFEDSGYLNETSERYMKKVERDQRNQGIYS